MENKKGIKNLIKDEFEKVKILEQVLEKIAR